MNSDTPKKINLVLGFDFGTKKIGTAIGQLITKTATPLTTIYAKDGSPSWQEIDQLLKQWQPDALVVGTPLNMDGTEQPITLKVYSFIKKLKEKYNLPIFQVDERLTTASVKTDIFEKKGFKGLKKYPIDNLAAKTILEDWFATNK